MSMFHFENKSLPFLTFFVFCMHCNPSCSLVCWTTDVEDACQPLTTILFKTGVKNSLKYLPSPEYKIHFVEFPVLYICNSLYYHTTNWSCLVLQDEAPPFYPVKRECNFKMIQTFYKHARLIANFFVNHESTNTSLSPNYVECY